MAGWSTDFDELAETLRRLELPEVLAIDHIGSTLVPGLVAKDVIDVQVRVSVIDELAIAPGFAAAGFRCRLETWNREEATRQGPEAKLVFAPPPGGRPANLHVRRAGGAGARDALLFRDHLRSTSSARDAWGAFKQSIVDVVPGIDLIGYGRIKQPAWLVLMPAADAWAAETGWGVGGRLARREG